MCRGAELLKAERKRARRLIYALIGGILLLVLMGATTFLTAWLAAEESKELNTERHSRTGKVSQLVDTAGRMVTTGASLTRYDMLHPKFSAHPGGPKKRHPFTSMQSITLSFGPVRLASAVKGHLWINSTFMLVFLELEKTVRTP